MNAPSFLSPLTLLEALRSKPACGRFVFAWEREDGSAFRYEVPLPAGAEDDPQVQRFCERCVKFVLWAAGGWKLYLSGPEGVVRFVEGAYAPQGARQFDRDIMGTVYRQTVTVVRCAADEVPATRDTLHTTGTSWEGCRIGFDLGASDFKIAAVENGVVRFNEEFPWDPKNATDPAYHYDLLNEGLKKAAAALPRVDAIGGSTAGVVVANCLRTASLLRGIPADRMREGQEMFLRLEREWKVPVEVANDGDVTALSAYLTSNLTGVLGVAMGSSQAGGFLNADGQLTGRLNELAFTPVDMDAKAPADEWSGDVGCGAMYFSQQATNHLAAHYGIAFPDAMGLPERLVEVQKRMKAGDAAARSLYETVGTHLGHAAAWYAEFYDYRHLLLLGRVTTGTGGDLILATAQRLLAERYPAVAGRVTLAMPDEANKRLGQSVAAAALARV